MVAQLVQLHAQVTQGRSTGGLVGIKKNLEVLFKQLPARNGDPIIGLKYMP
jgi:hypothetical protein